MNKFSKPPWSIEYGFYGEFEIKDVNGMIVCGGMNEQDGKLIVKAPELYEALKEMVYVEAHTNLTVGRSSDVWQKAKELLNRLEEDDADFKSNS